MRHAAAFPLLFLLLAGLAGCSYNQASPAPADPASGAHAMHTLEILSFDGCPNTPPVVEATEAAVRSLGDDWQLVRVDLEALPEDDLRRGYGSPTILYKGSDLFGQPAPSSPTLSCRHYANGVPDRNRIVAALGR